MILNSIIQEFTGLIPFAVILFIVFLIIPGHFFKIGTIIALSLVFGICVSCLNYFITQIQLDVLKFSPSELWMKPFEHDISQCGLQPKDVNIRYRFANDSVALTFFNTVTIDPMMWKGLEHDQAAIDAKKNIETFVTPKIPIKTKLFLDNIKNIMSPEAQKFIFKHELGHVFHNYSLKYIVLAGTMVAVATFIALISAGATITSLGGTAAIMIGLTLGGSTKLILGYSKNVFFKAREERMADDFAAQFSTKEEIEAAADFFEHYESHAQEYRKDLELNSNIPSIILTGYTDGKTRAQELRNKITI